MPRLKFANLIIKIIFLQFTVFYSSKLAAAFICPLSSPNTTLMTGRQLKAADVVGQFVCAKLKHLFLI